MNMYMQSIAVKYKPQHEGSTHKCTGVLFSKIDCVSIP